MMRNVMVAVMLVAAGCGSELPADGEPDQIDDAGKADSSQPLGNFSGQVKLGQIRDLTLNHDKSYIKFTQVIDCIPGPCRPEEGSYKYSHSSTTKYLRFYDADGNFVERYAYKLDGDKLSLKADHNGSWFYLTRTNLSALDDACGGFTRAPKQCAAGLQCVFTHGPDVPGTCQNPSVNPCVKAGGECVALTPSSCDGEVGDARQFSCGGGLGVECCFKH